MFNIETHGFINKDVTEREIRNLDFFLSPHKTDFSQQKSLDSYYFTTPGHDFDFSAEYCVLSFYRKDVSPYISLNLLDNYTSEFKEHRDKMLIELLFCCVDINLKTREKNYISLNSATMNSFTYQAKVFYDETSAIFYYTYENNGLHIVWIENTESILKKAKMISRKGFKGIFMRDIPLALEGNWEALYKIKKGDI